MNKYLSLLARTGRPGVVLPPDGTLFPQAPPGVRYLPGEDVLLLSVTLPKMSPRQRRTAVAFAVEDQISRPLEEVHVALGPETDEGTWLVGVVARVALPAAPPPGKRLLPDTLALPVPPAGHWSVLEAEGRVLIRLPDATGFVTRPPSLALLHHVAGSPQITLFGGQIGLAHAMAALPAVALPAPFDLTDPHGRTYRLPPLARRLLAVAAVGILGHLSILTADTLSLFHRQQTLADQLRDAAGDRSGSPIDSLVARILTPQAAPGGDGFLSLLGAVFAAAAPQSGSVAVRELRYDAARGALALTLQAADLGTLQEVEAGLSAAGLAVASGPAISANGTAEQQLTVQGPPT